jgi:hypothetical protein
VRRFFSSQSGKQSELSGFNPAQQLRICCEILREDYFNDNDFKSHYDLAVEYFTQWELQFARGRSGFASVSRPATALEQDLVRSASQPLALELPSLGDSQEDFYSLLALLRLQITSVVDPTDFPDGLELDRTANAICYTASRLISLFHARRESEKMMATIPCVFFAMLRYSEWKRER